MPADLDLSALRTAGADLAFGADDTPPVDPPIEESGVNLALNKPRDGNNADLSFGVAPPKEDVTLDGVITLPPFGVISNVVYSVNVWRGITAQSALPHGVAAKRRKELLAPQRPLARHRADSKLLWRFGQQLRQRHDSVWALLRRNRSGTAAPWSDGAPLRTEYVGKWRLPDRRRGGSAVLWQVAERVYFELHSGFSYPPRRRAEPGDVWTPATPREQTRHLPWQRGRIARVENVIPWNDTARIITLWPRPAKPVDPHPPQPGECLDPDRTRLAFNRLRESASPDLHFVCWGYTPPPKPQHSIPIRRTYIVIHDIEIKRIPDDIAITAASVALSLDADSWAWQWQAQLLGKVALDAVQPEVDGTPATLEVTINGYTWHLLVEDWTENREFGNRGITARGRGLSALLSAPYLLPDSGIVSPSANLTIQQSMGALLPIGEGFSIDWATGLADWIIPAGAWSYSNQTAIQVIADAAQQIGMVIVPAGMDKTLLLQARYPVLPWEFSGATPDLLVPEAAILNMSRRATVSDQANAVYVYGGEVGGTFSQVRRYLSAADRVANSYHSPLITDDDAARLIGGRILAKYSGQPSIRSLTMPLGGDYPLAAIGQLLRAELIAGDEHGIINAVAISAEMSNSVSVRQTLTVGEDTPNEWAKFKHLLPESPLLLGQITDIHADDTVTVAMLGGGNMRVRGTGVLGDYHYVRDRTLQGAAPVFSSPTTIDV